LRFLGQRVPEGLEDGHLDDFWGWAVPNWESERIPDTHMLDEH
jgi:hypothetical protein